MVFFYISKYVTKRIGPPMFRNGLRLRNKLTPPPNPGIGSVVANNNYWVDMACMIPYSQKLLSLAVYDESKQLATEFRKQHQKEKQEEKPKSKAEETMAAISMMTDPAATSKLSELRVDVLDKYLRPALMPNDRWSDIEDNWRYHLRIVAWARKEFLIGKYGPYIQEAMVAYPQLRNSPQLSSMASGNKRKLLLDLVHRGAINTDDIGGGTPDKESPFLRLPSTETILSAFRMKDWSNTKSMERIGQSLVPIASNLGGSVIEQSAGGTDTTKHVDVPVDNDIGSAGLEDILEVVTRGYVKNCGPLNALCQEANFYQLYSREYIQHLGDYLLKRTATRRMNAEIPQSTDHELLNETAVMSPDTIVLDIGAGDGLLMHCLRDYMERKVMDMPLTDTKKGKKRRDNRSGGSKNNRNRQAVIPTMVATDDMSWRIFAKAQVEKLSVEQALEKYASNNSEDDLPEDDPKQHPQIIVICSWMPMGQDWTSQFRNANVDEYILIGEADDGSCGDNWLTWGNPAFYDQSTGIENSNGDGDPDSYEHESSTSALTPPYAEEGYQRIDMDPLTKYQFSSFDLANSKSSKTVSFRRRKQKN